MYMFIFMNPWDWTRGKEESWKAVSENFIRTAVAVIGEDRDDDDIM